mmetsp:Transcript_39091/g.84725  ORF Transcript_39091/g.84725 Transcript_39091/m.84725 type:complete len:356 (+) Transcript_39091:8-1075(+)
MGNPVSKLCSRQKTPRESDQEQPASWNPTHVVEIVSHSVRAFFSPSGDKGAASPRPSTEPAPEREDVYLTSSVGWITPRVQEGSLNPEGESFDPVREASGLDKSLALTPEPDRVDRKVADPTERKLAVTPDPQLDSVTPDAVGPAVWLESPQGAEPVSKARATGDRPNALMKPTLAIPPVAPSSLEVMAPKARRPPPLAPLERGAEVTRMPVPTHTPKSSKMSKSKSFRSKSGHQSNKTPNTGDSGEPIEVESTGNSSTTRTTLTPRTSGMSSTGWSPLARSPSMRRSPSMWGGPSSPTSMAPRTPKSPGTPLNRSKSWLRKRSGLGGICIQCGAPTLLGNLHCNRCRAPAAKSK